MEIKWRDESFSANKIVLAGDIGGTNTNLALVGETNGAFGILLEVVFSSSEINGLKGPIEELLSIAQKKYPEWKIESACISAAGPVANNICKMTNVAWDIDGNILADHFDIPFLVINDFLGISYGIPVLDVQNEEQIAALTHVDGSIPQAQQATKAVIGPGTGMGVSFLVWDGDKYIPAPSEGGHIRFAPYNERSAAFRSYLEEKFKAVPGVEPLVSGMGIRNLFYYFRDVEGLPEDGIWEDIRKAKEADIAPLISKNAAEDENCAKIMRTFVDMLGHYAGDMAAVFLPLGGFYLAGGVVMKNQKWLEEEYAFVRAFTETYNPNLAAVLKKVPLYIIKDYSISLYGAANAAIQAL